MEEDYIMENNQGSSLLKKIIAQAPGHQKRLVAHSMDLSAAIAEVLRARNMTQHDLALLTGKRDSEISKWLGGTHNFTLKTIALIEDSLGTRLLHIRGFFGYEELDESASISLEAAEPNALEDPPKRKPRKK
jgi:transcriptional regulator with XRE-family HTH domain